MPFENPYRDKIHQHPEIITTRNQVRSQPSPHFLTDLQEDLDQLIVEVGSGSGRHLVELTRRNPSSVVIGFEIRYKRIVRTAEKLEGEGLTNGRVLQYDGNLFHTLTPPKSIDRFYLNFPDPWQKKRFQHKRIFLGDFLHRLHLTISAGGFFFFKTDHEDYFENFLAIAEEYCRSVQDEPYPLTLRDVTRDLHRSPHMDENILTEFEGLFIHKHKEPIKHFKLVKSTSESGVSS